MIERLLNACRGYLPCVSVVSSDNTEPLRLADGAERFEPSTLPEGYPAFSFVLPPWWQRWLLYYGAKIRIHAPRYCQLDVTPDSLGALLRGPRQLDVHWSAAPLEPTHLSIEVQLGNWHQQMRMYFPVPDVPCVRSATHGFEYVVGFDLGAKTIRACYQSLTHTRDGGMVALQEQAFDLLRQEDSAIRDEDIDYLMYGPNRRSNGLATRVIIRNWAQPQKVPACHAVLNFTERYCESLFRLFHKVDRPVLGASVLPPPKLSYYTHNEAILPYVTFNDGEEGHLDAGVLLNHFCAQVLHNLVLRGSKLRGVDPASVVILAAVPNLFSPKHVREMEEFLGSVLPAGDVRLIPEADAVAYYLLFSNEAMSPSVRSFNRQLRESLSGTGAMRIVVVDVGHGSVDCAVLRVAEPEKGMPRIITRLSETGSATGGVELNRIFADYLDRRLRYVFGTYGERLVGTNRLPFPLVTRAPGYANLQVEHARVLEAVETLIETLKAKMTANYCLTSSKRRKELAEDVVATIMDGMDGGWQEKPGFQRFASLCMEEPMLPCDLGDPGAWIRDQNQSTRALFRHWRREWRRARSWRLRMTAQQREEWRSRKNDAEDGRAALADLRRSLAEYVELNCVLLKF